MFHCVSVNGICLIVFACEVGNCSLVDRTVLPQGATRPFLASLHGLLVTVRRFPRIKFVPVCVVCVSVVLGYSERARPNSVDRSGFRVIVVSLRVTGRQTAATPATANEAL